MILRIYIFAKSPQTFRRTSFFHLQSWRVSRTRNHYEANGKRNPDSGRSSKTLLGFYWTVWRYFPENCTLHSHCCETWDSEETAINSMELNPSREAANYADTQEFPKNVWNPKVHYRVHKSLPLVPIMSQTNAVYTAPSYFYTAHFSIIRSSTSWSS
jgi:hypothetical protein